MDEKTIAFLQLKQEGKHNPQRPESTTFSVLGYWRRASCARSCLDFKNRLGRADACTSDRSGGEARCCGVCFSLQAPVTAVLRMSPRSPERLPLIWLARIAAARGAAPCSQLYQPAGLQEEVCRCPRQGVTLQCSSDPAHNAEPQGIGAAAPSHRVQELPHVNMSQGTQPQTKFTGKMNDFDGFACASEKQDRIFRGLVPWRHLKSDVPWCWHRTNSPSWNCRVINLHPSTFTSPVAAGHSHGCHPAGGTLQLRTCPAEPNGQPTPPRGHAELRFVEAHWSMLFFFRRGFEDF